MSIINRVLRMSSFFSNTFGFEESTYAATKLQLASMLQTEADKLAPEGAQNWQHNSFVVPNRDKPVDAGVFRFDSVAELREIARKMLKEQGFRSVAMEKSHFENGESRGMHSKFPGATYQAASQFNCLEFVSPGVTPERGITCYSNDRTQGPACAIACAAGTAFRNFFAPVAENLTTGNQALPEPSFKDAPTGTLDKFGQTEGKQLNGLTDVETIIKKMNPDSEELWRVKNGYIELTNTGVSVLPILGQSFPKQPELFNKLVNAVRVGCHFDTEITDLRANGQEPQLASQVYASACSIGYSRHPDEPWEPIAKIALYGAYEATFYAHIINECRWAKRGKKQSERNSTLFLTKLGGGVFQNPPEWICEAMVWAEKKTFELFADVAKDAQNADGEAKVFKFTTMLTHFRSTEEGYDEYIKKDYSKSLSMSKEQQA